MSKRVLIVEDTVLKYCDIKRAIQNQRGYSDANIDQAEYLDKAKRMLEDMGDSTYDLIITDMRYAVNENENEALDAGYQLIKYVGEKDLEIPIVICSTGRFRPEGKNVIGSVQYSEKRDLNWDLREVLEKI